MNVFSEEISNQDHVPLEYPRYCRFHNALSAITPDTTGENGGSKNLKLISTFKDLHGGYLLFHTIAWDLKNSNRLKHMVFSAWNLLNF
jgi:hypothetical protein